MSLTYWMMARSLVSAVHKDPIELFGHLQHLIPSWHPFLGIISEYLRQVCSVHWWKHRLKIRSAGTGTSCAEKQQSISEKSLNMILVDGIVKLLNVYTAKSTFIIPAPNTYNSLFSRYVPHSPPPTHIFYLLPHPSQLYRTKSPRSLRLRKKTLHHPRQARVWKLLRRLEPPWKVVTLLPHRWSLIFLQRPSRR